MAFTRLFRRSTANRRQMRRQLCCNSSRPKAGRRFYRSTGRRLSGRSCKAACSKSTSPATAVFCSSKGMRMSISNMWQKRSQRECATRGSNSLKGNSEKTFGAEGNSYYGFKVYWVAVPGTRNEVPRAERFARILVKAIVETLQHLDLRHRAIGADHGIKNNDALDIFANQIGRIGWIDFADSDRSGHVSSLGSDAAFGKAKDPASAR